MGIAGKYLGDAVYGALDGIVTTFAIVAGVAGASLGSTIILILGIANLLADGISMAAGNYLSKRSEQEYRKREREREMEEIDLHPAEEKEEVARIYATKGFSGRQLRSIVATVTRDKQRWARELADGHGMREQDVSPVAAGTTTFVAFVIAGSVPLLSYVLAIGLPWFAQRAFLFAIVFTAVTIFLVGSARSLLIAQKWWRAGTEMLLVGGVAAGAAYVLGYLLKGLLG